MTTLPLLVFQGGGLQGHVTHIVLLDVVRQFPYAEVSVISPFVSDDGVRVMLRIADAAKAERINWLVGLDGSVTSPRALTSIISDPRTAEPLAWNQTTAGHSLHCKVYFFKSRRPLRVVMYVGSANVTGAGLTSNVEAGAIFVAKSSQARELDRVFQSFRDGLQTNACVQTINHQVITEYSRNFRPARGRRRIISKIVGNTVPIVAGPTRSSDFAWIEVAVRGGSGNQMEICQHMAPHFLRGTNGQIKSRRQLVLIDRRTGISYDGNEYRFRTANTGYRVEFNTELARRIGLAAAATRRDFVRFQRTPKSDTFVVDVVPTGSQAANQMRAAARAEGRLFRTIAGPKGREYFVDIS